MHVLPPLEEVERPFPDELVVVGVHSGKFPAERVDANLRDAILRYEIHHPVINDGGFDVWSHYAVRAWPTLVFIDPQGRVIGRHEGEVGAEELADVVRELIEHYEALIDPTPVPGLRPLTPPEGTLLFPAKVLADAASGRLVIADSGHHRVIVCGLDGADPWIIGAGAPGLVDGDAATARFQRPVGLALEGDLLYVSDTGNHTVRRIDLAGRRVETIAGTGRLGRIRVRAGAAREIDLRSPWALTLDGRTLYIAMAGLHQLWALDLDEGVLRPFAGSGHEGLRDGDVERAWLAQPSGLSRTGRRLYVADSETSAIRAVDLPPVDQVRTIVGTGLFDFGDVDDIGDRVRLQHPLGVAAGDGLLYVADTYNNKIKLIDPTTRHAMSWLGDGEPGFADGVRGAARFHEPGGVSLAGDRLYIADTNNHAIRVADVETGAVTTLSLAL